MKKQTVFIVIKDGIVYDAFADHETDLVVFDLDTNDPDMEEEVQNQLELARQLNTHMVEIY